MEGAGCDGVGYPVGSSPQSVSSPEGVGVGVPVGCEGPNVGSPPQSVSSPDGVGVGTVEGAGCDGDGVGSPVGDVGLGGSTTVPFEVPLEPLTTVN